MAIGPTGIVHDFDRALLAGEHDFTSHTFKIALYTNDADLNIESTTRYVAGATGELTAAGDYVSGGPTLTVSVERDDIGYHVTASNVTLSNVPANTVFRGALIYNDSVANKAAVSVQDFGQDYTVGSNGRIELLITEAALGVPLLRVHTD